MSVHAVRHGVVADGRSDRDHRAQRRRSPGDHRYPSRRIRSRFVRHAADLAVERLTSRILRRRLKRRLRMTDETTKPKLEVVPDLDEEEQEFRALRRDLPGVKGAGDAGILTIGV